MTLREAGVTLLDCVHKTPTAVDVGFPYIAIPQMKSGRIDPTDARRISESDFKEWTRKAKPQPYDVLLSRRCNPGETAHVPPDFDFAVGQNLVLLRADGVSVYPPFLRWLTQSPDWWYCIEKHLNVGAVFDSLRCADVPHFALPIPPMAVQQRVADLLGALDDKIDLNRRMNQTLESMARALFKSWFVDFEPVVAKSEGRPTGLPPDLDALFPSEFEDSPLGEIPRGWSAGAIHDLAAMVRQQVNPLGTPEKLFAHHSIPAYDAAGAPVLEPGSAIKSNKFSVPKGSVLVSKLNPHIPRIWLTDVQDGQTAVASTEFFVLSPKQPVCSAFLYSMMSSPEFALDLQTLVTGTSNSHQRVQLDAFMNYATVVPRRPVAETFSELAKPLLDQVLTNRKESAALRAMRDDLLPRLLCGEVEVAEVEEMALG